MKRLKMVACDATMASRRFGNYMPEPEKAVRSSLHRRTPALERIEEAWKSITVAEDWVAFDEYDKLFTPVTRKIECTAKDIENFSLMLKGFEEERFFYVKAGLFLSALIEASESRRFTIHTSHLERKLDFIGYGNVKSVKVIGDVGSMAGMCMGRGSLRIDGSAGKELGSRMSGGTIIVMGDAGDSIGYGMEGGVIRLNGEYGVFGAEITGGRIYHKGVLLGEFDV